EPGTPQAPAGSSATSPGAGASSLGAPGPPRSGASGAGQSAGGSQTPRQPAPAEKPGAAPSPGVPGPGGSPAAGNVNPNSDVGVTANSIKVGHIGIYSGPVGYVGQHLSLAARATLQSINDAGGINGRKLDVLVRDDGWDGTKGMNAARDLVEREKIFAFCCIQTVSTTDPLVPYADQ